MVRLISFVLLAFGFSCTIIEDSDITSQEELDNLKLNSIEISQETGVGTTTSSVIVTKDSAINISVAGGVLNRSLWMDWPSLGSSSKLKLKSAITTSFKSYTSFLDSGKPWTFYLFNNDTTVFFEQYRFRYDENGRISRIIIIQDVDYLDTLFDDFIYDAGGKLTGIERTSNNPSKSGSFENFVHHTMNSTDRVVQFSFQGLYYVTDCQTPECGGTWGGDYNVKPGSFNNSFPVGVANLINAGRTSLTIEDRNNNLAEFGCPNCIRYDDTFYFHPLMILKDQFDAGDDLLFIYMADWWQPVTTQESTNDEQVTFTFKYGI